MNIDRAANAGNGSLTQIGQDGVLDLTFKFRFPPSADQLQDVKNAIIGANRLLCDATDGQMTMGTVVLNEGAIGEDQLAHGYYCGNCMVFLLTKSGYAKNCSDATRYATPTVGQHSSHDGRYRPTADINCN